MFQMCSLADFKMVFNTVNTQVYMNGFFKMALLHGIAEAEHLLFQPFIFFTLARCSSHLSLTLTLTIMVAIYFTHLFKFYFS